VQKIFYIIKDINYNKEIKINDFRALPEIIYVKKMEEYKIMENISGGKIICSHTILQKGQRIAMLKIQ